MTNIDNPGARERCPNCGAQEVAAATPSTVYACGSSDYDQRPGTFSTRWDDIESAHDFVVSWCVDDNGDTEALVAYVTARDAAIRAAARREALLWAAEWLGRGVPDEPTERTDVQQALVEAEQELTRLALAADGEKR